MKVWGLYPTDIMNIRREERLERERERYVITSLYLNLHFHLPRIVIVHSLSGYVVNMKPKNFNVTWTLDADVIVH